MTICACKRILPAPENAFMSSSPLSDSFAEYRVLDSKLCSFRTLRRSFRYLPVPRFADENLHPSDFHSFAAKLFSFLIGF